MASAHDESPRAIRVAVAADRRGPDRVRETIDIARRCKTGVTDHDHPPRESDAWDSPDFCPFCGYGLSDGGPGFIDHVENDENEACRDRFEQWRENVADDIGGEWSG